VPSRSPRVLVDAQAFQNLWSAERGIGRYLGELLHALVEARSDVQLSLVLNPDLAVPAQIDRLAGYGHVTFSDQLVPSDGDLVHVPSPFEPAPIDRVWPPAVRRLPLVVTAHDLIPFVLSDLYLQNASESRWFKTRLELLRRAAYVIAVSRATANDLVDRARVPAERVVVISEAPAERFKPHPDRASALRTVQAVVPRVRGGYVFYPGGMDRRKNIVRLVEAYTGLPADVRHRHQLVVACHLTKENRADVDRMLDEFGVADDVLFPGYVSDQTLVLLYQAAELVVFPSLYEGFGLPVAEAIACGAPVVASGTSSIPELVADKDALFDPYDPASIREKLLHALEDGSFLDRLRKARLADRHSWPVTAEETAAVYRSASRQPRSFRRKRPRLAVVARIPADARAAADTLSLLAALGRRCDVDTFGESRPLYLPRGVEGWRLHSLDFSERARGGYDAILSILGGGAHDVGALAVAKARGGHVLLRSGLTRLYALCARTRPDLEPRGFDGAVREMYGGRLAPVGGGEITPEDAERLGILMTAEVVEKAAGVYVQSAYGKQLVEIDAGASHAAKVAVVPPGLRDSAREDRAALVAARLAGGEREAGLILEALASLAADAPDLRFAVVIAPRGRHPRRFLGRLADEVGLLARVEAFPESDDERWRRIVRRAGAAIDVADTYELTISPFLAECLSANVPAVSLEIGPVREVPDDALIKVPADSEPTVLAQSARALLRDAGAPVTAGAAAYVRENSADALGERLYEHMFG
jgi:glycosyltransferase involved in cell wall biosynthesis